MIDYTHVVKKIHSTLVKIIIFTNKLKFNQTLFQPNKFGSTPRYPLGSHFVPLINSLTLALINLKLISSIFLELLMVFCKRFVLNQSSSSPRALVMTLMPLMYCSVISSRAKITTFSGVKGRSMFQQAKAVNWAS